MSSSLLLRLSDFRKIVALLGECRDLGDDAFLWRRHLAAGLARLAGSSTATIGEIGGFAQAADKPQLLPWERENALPREGYRRVLAEYSADPFNCPVMNVYRQRCIESPGISLARPDLLADKEWYRSQFYQVHSLPLGADEMVFCARPMLTDPQQYSLLAVSRPKGDRPFSGRDKAIIHEMNVQLSPMLGRELAGLAEPAPSALPRRSQAVLRCVLEGDSDKQISRRTHISPHTVNGHLKVIFRHFGVQSRSELLARWVRRGWKATAEADAIGSGLTQGEAEHLSAHDE
jgi:DNA-binding CsgD family transcriptional regulator